MRPTEKNEDGLAAPRERSSRDGMTYVIDFESQKIKEIVAELYYLMKCFGSCQFLRGLWMDISCEVANTHTRLTQRTW